MKYFVIALLLTGCQSTPIPQPEPQIIYIDREEQIKAYREWGASNIIPLRTRSLPNEQEICSNPLWRDTCTKERKAKWGW